MIGRCHCGRVVFHVDLDAPDGGGVCNCSFCRRRGWTGHAARLDQFRVLAGHDLLRCYRFGPGNSHNWFCGECGIHTHFLNTYDDPPDIRFSLGCCDDVDLDALHIHHIDGKAF